MNDKEKEELNRWCHTVLLGKCWHEPKQATVDIGCRFAPCIHCPGTMLKVDLDGIYNPDYTSSLDLASIVEAKAVDGDKVPYSTYEDKLLDIIKQDFDADEWLILNNGYLTFLMIHASAETRCKAARAAVEGE